MKLTNTSLLKIYMLCALLFSDFTLFAQIGGGPGDDSDDGTPVEDEDPALPISGKLGWLIIAGILFAAYKIATYRKQAHA